MNTPNRPIKFLAVALCVAGSAGLLTAGGCQNRNRFEMPEDATLEARAARVARAESLARDAQRQELAGNDDRAIALYRQALSEWRELPVAWHNLGVLLARKGRNLEAAEAYMTASELSPSDPISLYNLGTLWEDLGYLDDAARWYDERYDEIAHGLLRSTSRPQYLGGDLSPRRCRYCGRTDPETSFRDKAHAFPEQIGNKALIDRRECDACNRHFARMVEDDYAKWTLPMRATGRVTGKGLPSFKSRDHQMRIDARGPRNRGLLVFSAISDGTQS